MVDPTAEEKKELGNKAFAAKDYSSAIKYYSEAIEIDPTNHVYFSNRSASHGGLSDWTAAASDATECIRLDPTFIKGYYRLVSAQLELNDLSSALTTVKKGLNVDPDNSQLLRQLRMVKSKRATAKNEARQQAQQQQQQDRSSTITPTAIPAGSSPLSREIMDLQSQYVTTTREFRTVKAHIAQSQKEQKLNNITQSELSSLPMSDDVRLYRSVGKMFLLSTRTEVMDHLEATIEGEKKREVDLTQKAEYLERRMTSQKENIRELVKSVPQAE